MQRLAPTAGRMLAPLWQRRAPLYFLLRDKQHERFVTGVTTVTATGTPVTVDLTNAVIAEGCDRGLQAGDEPSRSWRRLVGPGQVPADRRGTARSSAATVPHADRLEACAQPPERPRWRGSSIRSRESGQCQPDGRTVLSTTSEDHSSVSGDSRDRPRRAAPSRRRAPRGAAARRPAPHRDSAQRPRRLARGSTRRWRRRRRSVTWRRSPSTRRSGASPPRASQSEAIDRLSRTVGGRRRASRRGDGSTRAARFAAGSSPATASWTQRLAKAAERVPVPRRAAAEDRARDRPASSSPRSVGQDRDRHRRCRCSPPTASRVGPFGANNLTLTLSLLIWLVGDEIVDALFGSEEASPYPLRDTDAWSYLAPIGNLLAGWWLLGDRQHERFITGFTGFKLEGVKPTRATRREARLSIHPEDRPRRPDRAGSPGEFPGPQECARGRHHPLGRFVSPGAQAADSRARRSGEPGDSHLVLHGRCRGARRAPGSAAPGRGRHCVDGGYTTGDRRLSELTGIAMPEPLMRDMLAGAQQRAQERARDELEKSLDPLAPRSRGRRMSSLLPPIGRRPPSSGARAMPSRA